MLSFKLNSQDVNHVGGLNRVFNFLVERHAVKRKKSRQESFRSGEVNFHSHFSHRVNVGAGNAAVQNVADNRNFQTCESSFALFNREQIQQGLRGVRVCSVAGVDYYGLDGFCREVSRALRLVPHDNRVDAHSLNRAERVAQTFTLDDRTCPAVYAHNVRAQIFSRQLKRSARPCRRLVKQIHNRFAAQV